MPQGGQRETLKQRSERCEYNPEKRRARFEGEPCRNLSEWVVGANGQWRLCGECSHLPAFNRFRRRTRIKRS